jgi:hypothetical protein
VRYRAVTAHVSTRWTFAEVTRSESKEIAAGGRFCGARGLANELIARRTSVRGTGQIKCRERLGGVVKFYHREAAWLSGRGFRTRQGERVVFCPQHK